MGHPARDEIAAEVRSWYQKAHPDMGYTAERRWFGVVRGHERADFRSTTVTELSPADVGRLRDELLAAYDGHAGGVNVVGEVMTGELHDALLAAGLEPKERTTYLLHSGRFPDVAEPDGFSFDRIEDLGRISEFSRVKVMGFDSTEVEPDQPRIEFENGFREADLHEPDNGLAIGRIDDEPASIIAWYGGTDTLIYLLATRVPFRRRGLGSTLIRTVAELERGNGARSVMINADLDDDPVDLYRRLGFDDEIYREHRYWLTPR